MAASGDVINGPTVRVPPGSWKFVKEGTHNSLEISVNDSPLMPTNSQLVLGQHSSVRVVAKKAQELTIKLEN